MLVLALLLQSVIGPPGDGDIAPPKLTEQRCNRDGDEIVVCGRTRDSQRLMPLAGPEVEPVFGPAAVRISPNKTLSVRTESSSNPMITTPRVMAGVKIVF